MDDQLKNMIRDALAKSELVIGWGPGPNALSGAPLFMRKLEDADNFRAGLLAVQNTALFLPEYKTRKVGVVVKGCDARSVVQQIAEGFTLRENLTIIGFPCEGVLDLAAVGAKLAEFGLEPGEISALGEERDVIRLGAGGKDIELAKADFLAGKCKRCRYPNALERDYFAGIERAPAVEADDFSDLAAFESMPLEERLAFWQSEMSRCIRCYACRNACPLCVCRDHCVAGTRSPHWLTQADAVRDKLFFQIIHAVHLAGRCTGCGECQRACPAGIPLMLLKRTMGRSMEELFAWQAGLSMEALPPLQTFQVEEENIKEREW